MPSKPAISDSDGSANGGIGGWQVLEVAGRDAAAFLQRQTMNDVAALTASAQWQWSGLLSSKGRLQCLLIVQRRASADSFWLVAADTPSASLQEQLSRYVFRDKLTLTRRDDLLAIARWGQVDEPLDGSNCDPIADRITNFEFPFGDGRRTLQIMSLDDFERAADHGGLNFDADSDARWRLDDLRCGIPRLSPEQTDRWTPHMLALDRLDAFSLRKGCYPGQEIIARTHYLGRSKRRLQRFDLSGPSYEDEPVVSTSLLEPTPVVLAASWNGEHSVCLIAPIDTALDSPRTAGGLSLIPMPFAPAAGIGSEKL